MNWYLDVLRKYAEFNGRARRMEYWMFALINFGISILLSVVVGFVSETLASVVSVVYALGVLIPSIAVGIRRLHDTGRTGWWILIGLVPVVGWIVLIIFMVLDSDAGTNQYGPSPK